MLRLGKYSAIAVLSLAISLALFTTSVFAQGASQSIDHGNISVSTHAAVGNTVALGTARVLLGSALMRPNGVRGNCGNWGWGDGCGSFDGCHGSVGCGGCNNCFHPIATFRCSSEKICSTVEVCHWSRWGRVCRGEHRCRSRSICRRCFNHDGGGIAPWGVKRN